MVVWPTSNNINIEHFNLRFVSQFSHVLFVLNSRVPRQKRYLPRADEPPCSHGRAIRRFQHGTVLDPRPMSDSFEGSVVLKLSEVGMLRAVHRARSNDAFTNRTRFGEFNFNSVFQG